MSSDIPDFTEEQLRWLEDHIFNKMQIIGLSFEIIRRKMKQLEDACKGVGIECRISFEEARKRLKDQGGK